MQILEWLVLYLISRIPKGESYVRMLVVREIRLHNGANCCAIATTHMERGYYQQQSGSSRWLLALESMLVGIPTMAASLSHASQSERKEGKQHKSEKEMTRGSNKKNGLKSMDKQDDLADRRGLRSEAQL